MYRTDNMLFCATALQCRMQGGEGTVPGNTQRRLVLQPFTAQKGGNDVMQAGGIAIGQLQGALVVTLFQAGAHQRSAQFAGGAQAVQRGAVAASGLGLPA